MIDQKKYIIKKPKAQSRHDKTIYQSEIEKALWTLGVNYYRLSKEDEEIILKLANKY
jgi:hypothetical protein